MESIQYLMRMSNEAVCQDETNCNTENVFAIKLVSINLFYSPSAADLQK